jgi:two-component system, NarL family, nitrate/nitrite response regulator NarL
MKSSTAARMPSPVRVLVVDDEPLFVEMVQALLQREGDLEVVGRAGHGQDAVRLAAQLDPDVVVMDISMPVMDGIDATRAILQQNPRTCVLILTGGSNIAEIDDARKAGAAGYLTKDRIANDLVAEIRSVAAR